MTHEPEFYLRYDERVGPINSVIHTTSYCITIDLLQPWTSTRYAYQSRITHSCWHINGSASRMQESSWPIVVTYLTSDEIVMISNTIQAEYPLFFPAVTLVLSVSDRVPFKIIRAHE